MGRKFENSKGKNYETERSLERSLQRLRDELIEKPNKYKGNRKPRRRR